MLCTWFVLSAVAMAAVQANDSYFQNLASFNMYPGYALFGHVIETLSIHKADCTFTCKKRLSCFSANVYKDQYGNYKCDLNRSNKKQSPNSLVRMSGYNYTEPADNQFCIDDKCTEKSALPANVFKFNSSSYNLFADPKNWTSARQVCQTHGGDLASFSSPVEMAFVFQTLLYGLSMDMGVSFLKLRMDGSDANLSLASGAVLQTNEGRQALHVDKGDYAEVPRFDLHLTNWTFAMWVKPKNEDSGKLFLGHHAGTTAIELDFDTDEIKIELETPSMEEIQLIATFNPSLTANTWTHLVITWDKDSRIAGCYTNGSPTPVAPNKVPNADPELLLTTEPMYKIGKEYQGWITDMVVFSRIMTQEEILKLKDSIDYSNVLEGPQGAWIGLNDKISEGVIHWSDGSPLTFSTNQGLNNNERNDCGLLYKKSEEEAMKSLVECERLALFVCQYP